MSNAIYDGKSSCVVERDKDVICGNKTESSVTILPGKIKHNDTVNHPSHYTFGRYETIDVIEDWDLDIHEANFIKYISRAKHKGNELEDLKKAQFYLNRLINNVKKKNA